jgi:tetratricopeptide (TPR) repeat protein
MATISEALTVAREYRLAGRLPEAEEVCLQVLNIAPDYVPAWYLLGTIALDTGRFEAAAAYFGRAVVLMPELAEAHIYLGAALQSQGKHEEAADCNRRALALRPDYVEAHYNLGNALKNQQMYAEAIACYDRALQLRPGFAEAANNLGVALREQGRLEDAITFYQKAIQSNPEYVGAYVNVGNALKDLGRTDEALGWYDRALELKTDHVEAHQNLGSALLDLGRVQDAVECYERALALKPDLAEAHKNLSQTLLLIGDFERGWQEYEWRWKTRYLTARHYGKPTWNGEALNGKTILLHTEQGFGDTIQFIRYAKLVKALGANVIVECEQQLVNLLASAAEFDRLIAKGSALPDFDTHAPLLRLPGIVQTRLETIPADVPYLFADESLVEEWRERLSARIGERSAAQVGQRPPLRGGARTDLLRVGINWRGREGRGPWEKRNVPVRCFEALARFRDIRFLSLQKEASRNELAEIGQRLPMVEIGTDIDETHGAFMDTAAIMMNLDLVITSDTSVAHLAGALGVPVWVALPFVPDWRWLLDRNDSPWYPTMRLFRQKQPGDWAGVFEEIEAALAERVQSSRFKVQG